MFDFKRFRKLYIALITIIIICFIGVAGFVLIENYKVSEALFMTVITVTTVGYQEVIPLSVEGRYFTIFLIVTSFGTFAYAISAISSYLVDGEFKRHLHEIRKIKKLEKLKNHIIVCGYGRNGKQIVQELRKSNQEFVLIDHSSEAIQDAIHEKCHNFIDGEATDDDVLIEAGIKKAKALITTLPEDADNVFVSLTAREMNSNLTIISRASKDSSYNKLRRAGANHVVMPDKVGGSRMASLVLKPDVVEFFNQITGQDENISIEEISFESLPEEFKNKTIGNLEINKRSGANIVGLKSKEGKYIINPPTDYIINDGSKIFVLGMKNQIEKLLKCD